MEGTIDSLKGLSDFYLTGLQVNSIPGQAEQFAFPCPSCNGKRKERVQPMLPGYTQEVLRLLWSEHR